MGMFGDVASAVGGSVVSSAAGLWSQHEERQANENMYRHRYRTMVADLKAAGLNPMLAYMKDAGTPPAMGPAAIGDLGPVINQARTSSSQAALQKAQIEVAASQAEANSAQAAKSRAEASVIEGYGAKESEARIYRDTGAGGLSDATSAQVRRLTEAVVSKATSDAEAAALLLPKMRNLAEAEGSNWKRYVAPYLDDAVKVTQSASSLMRSLSATRIMDILEDSIGKVGRPSGPVRGDHWKGGVYRNSKGRFTRDKYGPSGEAR